MKNKTSWPTSDNRESLSFYNGTESSTSNNWSIWRKMQLNNIFSFVCLMFVYFLFCFVFGFVLKHSNDTLFHPRLCTRGVLLYPTLAKYFPVHETCTILYTPRKPWIGKIKQTNKQQQQQQQQQQNGHGNRIWARQHCLIEIEWQLDKRFCYPAMKSVLEKYVLL